MNKIVQIRFRIDQETEKIIQEAEKNTGAKVNFCGHRLIRSSRWETEGSYALIRKNQNGNT